jgi:hypothetical protein
MTDAPPKICTRLVNYAKGIIVVNDDNTGHFLIRSFAKGYFDLLKNLIAVGVLMAIARKIDNIALDIVTTLSLVVIVLHLATFTQTWRINILHGSNMPRLESAVTLFFRYALTGVSMLIIWYGIMPAVYAVMAWNTK